jgi:hypothetical protein
MGLGSALKMRSTPEKTDKEVFGGKLISEQRASFVVRVTYVLTKGCADPQTGKGDAIRDLLDQRPGAPQGRRSDPDSTIPVDHEREGEITCSQQTHGACDWFSVLGWIAHFGNTDSQRMMRINRCIGPELDTKMIRHALIPVRNVGEPIAKNPRSNSPAGASAGRS